ncbi:MAG: flavodoxin family protein [Bellilinea sp.]|jgi:flavodoxin
MNILVLYDSVFGNTEKIARAVAAGLETTDCLPVSQAAAAPPAGLHLLVIGSPTRGFRPTEAISRWLSGLGSQSLSGMRAAAFDTRIVLGTIQSPVFRFIVDKGGYAANTIAKTLQKKGARLAAPGEGFFVTGEQGPLKDGELERAEAWAQHLLQSMRQEQAKAGD